MIGNGGLWVDFARGGGGGGGNEDQVSHGHCFKSEFWAYSPLLVGTCSRTGSLHIHEAQR